MSIPFELLSSILKQHKKKTGKGITGLPTFSYDDPRYQQRTSEKPYLYTKPPKNKKPCLWGATPSGDCKEDTDDTEELDVPKGNDLFDPWKYRGVTNEHMLYNGRPMGAEEDIN